mgnify:CR=1 FL=1|jgi:hypothetical protein
MWQGWVNSILGLWLIVSPFILAGDAAKWSTVVSGVIVAVLSFWANSSQGKKVVSKEA